MVAECGDLFDVKGPRDFRSLTAKFNTFHADNPHVWVLFKRFAREAYNSGRDHYSARAIFHRIRWHISIETKSDDDFKINNNHSPFYARMLAAEECRFEFFFRNRAAEADSAVLGRGVVDGEVS